MFIDNKIVVDLDLLLVYLLISIPITFMFVIGINTYSFFLALDDYDKHYVIIMSTIFLLLVMSLEITMVFFLTILKYLT